jgi:hypothetical protein
MFMSAHCSLYFQYSFVHFKVNIFPLNANPHIYNRANYKDLYNLEHYRDNIFNVRAAEVVICNLIIYIVLQFTCTFRLCSGISIAPR